MSAVAFDYLDVLQYAMKQAISSQKSLDQVLIDLLRADRDALKQSIPSSQDMAAKLKNTADLSSSTHAIAQHVWSQLQYSLQTLPPKTRKKKESKVEQPRSSSSSPTVMYDMIWLWYRLVRSAQNNNISLKKQIRNFKSVDKGSGITTLSKIGMNQENDQQLLQNAIKAFESANPALFQDVLANVLDRWAHFQHNVQQIKGLWEQETPEAWWNHFIATIQEENKD